MAKDIKKIVKTSYAKIATLGGCCSCKCSEHEKIAKSLGYSDNDIKTVPEANLGLGCGNPTALDEMREGMTILDLGSGAGFDAFLAAKKVGKSGKVIGVDMTEAMIAKAQQNAKKYGYANTEFRLGDIEALPVDDGSIDIAMSNCVINLAPNKEKVFSEAYRVLKKGGKLLVSDIVLLDELTAAQRKNDELIAGCVGGAILRDDYLALIKKAGFTVVKIDEDKDISKRQYKGIALESLKVVARK